MNDDEFSIILFLCTPIDNTNQIFFTKLNFHSSVPPLIIQFKYIFFKINFSYLCTPIDIV